MATTYKDYYISYNGSIISRNEDTGLTAVNIYYNGTYLGEGTHALNCGGKYMSGNVVIGQRLLNCGGKYMSGNVVVSTQARYRWNKYNAVDTHVMQTESVASGADVFNVAKTSANHAYVFARAPQYAFDAGQGLYSFPNGGYWIEPSSSHQVGNPSYYSRPYIDSQPSGVDSMGYGYATAYKTANACRITANGENTRYTQAATKAKGDTHYGVVNSTSAGAYPQNGEQDGYWYVAI